MKSRDWRMPSMELVDSSVDMGHLPVPDCYIFAAAQGWFDLGELDESAQEIQRLSETAQGDLDVLHFSTRLFCGLRQFERSKETAFKVLQAAPDDLDAWLILAECIFRLDGASAAVRCLAKLERLLDQNHRYCIALGRYFALLGDKESATEWLCNSLSHGDARKEMERFPELKPYLAAMSAATVLS